MKVEIEQYSGFCFGVQNAIKKTEEALKSGETIYCLGHIVHNEAEVERLEKLGMVTVSRDEFQNLKNSKVVIRAHGEPPETYETARRNNLEIIEATCPIVRNIQNRVKQNFDKNGAAVQSLIFGKKEHAEVKGLMGQTAGRSILLSSQEDIHKIDYNKPAEIFSQTTRSRKKYRELIRKIREGYEAKGYDGKEMLRVHNTICGQVANREPRLKKFCREHEVIIFVSGKSSSNGKMLYGVCENVNKNAYFISDSSEIKESWFEGISTVGVCGATSTPKWLIKEVADKIEGIKPQNI